MKPNLGDIIELDFSKSEGKVLGGRIVYALVTKLDVAYDNKRLGFEAQYFDYIVTPTCYLPYDSYTRGMWRIVR